MLTASQCEVIAFVTNGEILCRDCAKAKFGEIRIVSCEEGLNRYGDLTPLSRYEVEEFDRQRIYDAAQEQYENERPKGTTQAEEWREIERLVEALEDAYTERCGACGEVLA
jgi:hypothetical protein